jgi:membrane fusion protein, multidrug efflux system
MNNKTSLISTLFFAAISFLLFFSCKSKPEEVAKAKGPMVVKAEAYIVKASAVSDKIEVPGSLLPFETTEIHPEVAGKIVKLNIKDGQMVTKGNLLVKLFDGDLQAQLHKLAVQLEIAEKTQQRSDALLKINAISQQDYDLATLQVSTTRADMQIIRASIEKTEIRAPFSGKIGFKNVSIGAYVSPTTVICTLDIVNQLKLEFSVPEKYNSKVANGQSVTFGVENSPKTYSAKVIATEVGITENTRSLKVRAVVESADKFVSPGVFAKVKFDMGTDNNAIMIPTQAIIPGARDKKVAIYRDSVANFQVVTTGIRDSANVQVLTGLKIGDTILISGLLSIKPGSKVVINKIKS